MSIRSVAPSPSRQGSAPARPPKSPNRPLPRTRRGPVDHWAELERVARLCDLDIDYVDCPDNDPPHSSETLERAIHYAPPIGESRRTRRVGGGLPDSSADVARMCQTPLLSHADEVFLFCSMNYLKFRAATLRASLNPQKPTPLALVEEIESLLDQAALVRNHILRANLRLVISIAKKFVNAANTFEDLVSEGNLSLLRAAEKFNFSLGNRFSTYATRAIRNNLFHYVSDGHRRRQRFQVAEDDCLRSAPDRRGSEHVDETLLRVARGTVERLLAALDPQKRAVLQGRFGLTADGKPMTLKTIAGDMGVSRERVRQIEARALREMRELAKDLRLAAVDDLF